jgi:hypothetical protein
MLASPSPLRDFDANSRSAERCLSPGEIQFLSTPGLDQHVLGPLPGRFGSGQVDVLGVFSRVRQYDDVVRLHFHKTAPDGKEFILLTFTLDLQLAKSQACQQRRMIWQDTQHALRARRDDHTDLFIEQLSFDGQDFKVEC